MNYLYAFSNGRRYILDDFPFCLSVGSVVFSNGQNYVVKGYTDWRTFFDQYDNEEMTDDEFDFAVVLEPCEVVVEPDKIRRDIKINQIL